MELFKKLLNSENDEPITIEDLTEVIQVANRYTRFDTCDFCNCKNPESYMVTDSTWKEAGFNSPKGIICLECFENDLGRKLVADDFKDAPINGGILYMLNRP